ncbi:MAG: peptidylprolyl isomerase [Rhodospirillales bacterium]|nr:peptidylprolyl isomerase [Rhodospirillales bacterium]
MFVLAGVVLPPPARAAAPAPPATPIGVARPAVRIIAVVNGTPITNIDVNNRARLFALSAGLSLTPEVLDRLRPQIVRQLIDEHLRMQAVEKAHIVVPDKAIADAIGEIEQHNGMPQGALRQRLAKSGVAFSTLVDQVRTQLGWTRLLRETLGSRAIVTPAEIAARQRLLAQQVGKPEYHVAEIFIPIESGAGRSDAERFASTVIGALRAGAPFPVAAAQFSQSQTALAGGDLGWVQANQLDPAVAQVVAEMPVGAVSNPIPVPGGLDIVTLAGKRIIGQDVHTVLSVREVFLPFSSPLNPAAPTAQQIAALKRAHQISLTVKSCAQMEQVAVADHSPRPADPGVITLDQVQPPTFRAMLDKLQPGKTTQPVVAPDGIAVLIECSRDRKNLSQLTPKEIKVQILSQRVDLLSRQLQQDLRSQAQIEMHPAA